MAYMRSLRHTCAYAYCQKEARYEVVNRWNTSNGAYCKGHAKIALRVLEDLEKEKEKRARAPGGGG